MRTSLAGVLLVLLALGTGCGGDDSSPGGGSSEGSSYDDARDVVDALGCSGTYSHIDSAEAEMFTSDSGECEFAGDTITVNWFNTAEAVNNYREIAAQFGGNAVYGDNWAVQCQDKSACDAVQDELGGEVG